MMYTYKSSKHGLLSSDTMKRAMASVRNGVKIREAARRYHLPRTTLRRHLLVNDPEKHLGRFRPVFTAGQEMELVKLLKLMDKVFFGLTLTSLRALACEYADQNQIPHPFVNGKAGEGWTYGFLKRYPDLSLRTPEATSIGRAVGFNRPQVDRLFQLLRQMYIKHDLRPRDVYNVDETGMQTSSNRPPKVISVKGKKQVGVIASAEKGKTVTAICCCNAEGRFIPPALIFPRKRMNNPALMDGAPTGTLGLFSDSGWVNTDLFLSWFQFFVQHVKPTEEYPTLLIVDNHESHRAISVIDYAAENNVVMHSVPPHMTHRLQPLDRTVYGPLSTYYEQEVDKFQKSHPGRRIQMTDMSKLFRSAYEKACSVKNAVAGFAKCGIHPYNAGIFTDEDFAPSMVTYLAEDEVALPRGYLHPNHQVTPLL